MNLDLLVGDSPIRVGPLTFGIAPDELILPVIVDLMRAMPQTADGGRLYPITLPEGADIAIPIQSIGSVSLGCLDGRLRVGIPAPFAALFHVESVRRYTTSTERIGGQVYAYIALPPGAIVRFKLGPVDIAARNADTAELKTAGPARLPPTG